MTDLLGRPVALLLTPGNISDISAAPALVSHIEPVLTLLADKGYDANALRGMLRAQGTRPVIPARRNRKKAIRYDRDKYKERWRVEARLLSAEGLPPDRNTLRQTGQKLPVSCDTRDNSRLLGLIESQP